MAEIALRRWLMKQPYPELVEAEFADGTEKRVRIGLSRSKWRDAEEALKGVVRAEALDKDDNVLRKWESDEAPAATPKKDAQMLRDIELARIIAEAGDRAVARYENIMRTAFEQNAKLLALVGGRLAAIERAYHDRIIAEADAVAAEREAQADANDPNAPLVAQIVGSALASMSAGANGAPPKQKE